jgi:hypothetical protein
VGTPNRAVTNDATTKRKQIYLPFLDGMCALAEIRRAHRVDSAGRCRPLVVITIGHPLGHHATEPHGRLDHVPRLRNPQLVRTVALVDQPADVVNRPRVADLCRLRRRSAPLVRSTGARRTAMVAFAFAFALSLALIALGLGFALPWMLGFFAVGVVAAQITVAGRQRLSRDWAWR